MRSRNPDRDKDWETSLISSKVFSALELGPLYQKFLPKNFPEPFGGRIPFPSADARPTVAERDRQIEVSIPTIRRISHVTKKVVSPVKMNERFESASLGGTAPPIFPMGLARPNAASGERDSAKASFERIFPALRREFEAAGESFPSLDGALGPSGRNRNVSPQAPLSEADSKRHSSQGAAPNTFLVYRLPL